MFGLYIDDESRKTKQIVARVSALFKEKRGKRLLGRVRFCYSNSVSNLEYTLVAYLGTYDGPEVDLKHRIPDPDDPRSETVLEVISLYTQREVFRAFSTQTAWSRVERRCVGSGEQVVIEYLATSVH
jgi:hypothetical protein